jgi:hypothetical protein
MRQFFTLLLDGLAEVRTAPVLVRFNPKSGPHRQIEDVGFVPNCDIECAGRLKAKTARRRLFQFEADDPISGFQASEPPSTNIIAYALRAKRPVRLGVYDHSRHGFSRQDLRDAAR